MGWDGGGEELWFCLFWFGVLIRRLIALSTPSRPPPWIKIEYQAASITEILVIRLRSSPPSNLHLLIKYQISLSY